jgi:deoxyhypusine synthase
MTSNQSIDASVINNVMQPSNSEATAKLTNSSDSHEIRGYDLNKGIDYVKILNAYKTTGFQATNFANAVNEINRMVNINIQSIEIDKV